MLKPGYVNWFFGLFSGPGSVLNLLSSHSFEFSR